MEKKENVVLKLKGIVKFPFYDDETKKLTFKLLIDDKTLTQLEDEIECLGEELAINNLTHDNIEFNAINCSSRYVFSLFDKDGGKLSNELDKIELYDGASVVAKINFKKYEYTQKKGRNSFTKTGVTGYIMGILVIEQGLPYQQETTYDEFKGWLEDESLQF